AVNGVIYTAHWWPGLTYPTSRAFFEAFQKRYNRDPDYSAVQANSAARAAVDAIKRAGTLDRQKIRDAIAATKDLDTAKGLLSFKPNGDPTYESYLVQIKDGKVIAAPE